jgi:hypothetical protein
MPVIPALGRMRQEVDELETSLACIVRPCLRKIKIVIMFLSKWLPLSLFSRYLNCKFNTKY